MKEEIAEKIMNADLAQLAQYSRGLCDRISSAPDRFLKLVIAVTMLFFTLVKLTSDLDLSKVGEILHQYGVALSSIYGIVTLIGLLSILDLVRSRHHYVTIIKYNNVLRKNALCALQFDNLKNHIWTDTDVRMWPWDSASTFAFLSVVLVTAVISWVSVYAAVESFLWAFLGSAFVVGVSFAASCRISRKVEGVIKDEI